MVDHISGIPAAKYSLPGENVREYALYTTHKDKRLQIRV